MHYVSTGERTVTHRFRRFHSQEHCLFVANRVATIQAVKSVTWHYVPTDTNPADIGSRGGQLTTLWLKGPPGYKIERSGQHTQLSCPRQRHKQKPRLYERSWQ